MRVCTRWLLARHRGYVACAALLAAVAVCEIAAQRLGVENLDAARRNVAPVPDVRIGVASPISDSYRSLVMLEPHIAAHPTKTGHLLAAAMIAEPAASFPAMRSSLRCVVFLSRDGGQSWSGNDLGISTCYDPWTAFSADGTAALSLLGNHASHPLQNEGLLVFSSPDAGATWSDVPVALGTQHDRPMMVAGGTATRNSGWLYLVSSRNVLGENGAAREAVFVARSRAGGQAFDEPRLLTPNNLVLRAEPPVVRADGSLVVQYVEAGYFSTGARSQVLFDRRRAYTMESADGGFTFSSPRFIGDACGPPRFATAAMVLHGADERMTHYCNAVGGRSVMATTSIHASELWTEAISVHPELPSGHSALVRAAAANAAGTLGVVYSTRHQQGERRCYDVFFTASTDGGGTYSPPARLGTGSYCPDAVRNGVTISSWPDGGDYYGIATDVSGRFHVVWPDARSGVFQLYTAPVDVTSR